MARASTTSDVFNAVGDPARRQIMDLLRNGERPVSDVVDAIGLEQPSVSKHLRVLREVGLVCMRRAGRHRFYRLDASGLRSVHDWSSRFEAFWDNHLEQIKHHAESPASPTRRTRKEPRT